MNKKLQLECMERVNTLDSRLIPSATHVLDKAWRNKIQIYVLWGSRTVEQQNLLYRFGRTLPGDIITIKRGGYSPHNYGLALDFCLVYEGKMLTWEEAQSIEFARQRWSRAIKLFESEGWESGWRGVTFEPGHVQNMLGNTMGELCREYERQIEDRNYRI